MILFDIDADCTSSVQDVNNTLGTAYTGFGCDSQGRAIAFAGEVWYALPENYVVLINPEVD